MVKGKITERVAHFIIVICFIIVVISIILIEFNRKNEDNKLNNKIEFLQNYTLKIDSRLDNIMEYVSGEWMIKHNLSKYEWTKQLKCSTKSPTHGQINRIAYSFISTIIIIEDKPIQINYYADKSMGCFMYGELIDCKSVLCQ